MTETLIAIDWGSTNLRCKLIIDGRVSASSESPDGIRNRNGRDFDDLLTAACGAWKEQHPDAGVLMSGMIGSREGWREVPYVIAPATLADLATGMTAVTSPAFGEIFIVPGVRWDDPDRGTTDVMRGEETQIAGLLTEFLTNEATLCLPGTHSKWVHCQDGRIESFRTFLTGEAFDLLTRGSLIAGNGGAPDPENPAFARGLELSGNSGGLLHHLFLGRTEMLTGRVPAEDLRSLVSGLLIGNEVREALRFTPTLKLLLVGDSRAATATAKALDWFGVAYKPVAEDTHLDGILAIARLL